MIHELKNKYPVTVLMNSYREREHNFRMAVESILRAGCSQFIISTVAGDPCKDWVGDYPISKVIFNEKPGIFEQINAMLPFINQPYVCYASSNDVMFENKLSLEVKILEDTKKDVCYSAFMATSSRDHNGKVCKFPDYNYSKHLSGNFVSDCAMVRTPMLLKYTPFRTEYGNISYHDLWLRIYEGEGNVFIKNDEPTWLYIITSESQHIRRRKNPKKIAENNRHIQKMLADHKNNLKYAWSD